MTGKWNGRDRDEQMLSVKQVVAVYYGRGIEVSQDTVRRMCEKKELVGSVKVGGRWFIPPESIK